MGPAIKCVLSNETPLEKTNFSFVSSYKLEIASVLGMGASVCFHPQYGPHQA